MRVSLLLKSGAVFNVDTTVEPQVTRDAYGNQVVEFTEDHNVHVTTATGIPFCVKKATVATKSIEATFEIWTDCQ